MSSFVRASSGQRGDTYPVTPWGLERQREVPVTVPRHTSLKELTIHNSDRFNASTAPLDA